MSEVRTYGGWRLRRGMGLLGLDTAGTFTLLGIAALILLVSAAAPAFLLYLAPPCAIAALLGFIRVNGASIAHLLLVRCRWRWGVLRGHNVYRAGIVIDHPRAFQLPGVLAPLTLLSTEDGYGSRYGIVWDRRTGLLTATLRVVPASTWLGDRAEVDRWVASWGGWLAGLGYQPAVRWVTVTVDTAPEPGSTLADAVNTAIGPASPEQARNILDQLVAAAPAAAADVDTRVSITFDPNRSPTSPKGLAEALGELGRTLDGLAAKLNGCGVTVLGRASASDLAGIIRSAYDPQSRGEVNHLLAQRDGEILGWSDAGPVGATEYPECYQHDGGTSVSWGWHEPPRQNVHSDVLSRLVAPGPFPKRVTLLYRALPAAVASQVLQREVNAAAFRAQVRRKTGRDETARDAHDAARARQAAAEEAAGAGVCLVSLYATITVTDPADLGRAVAHTESAADTAKIRLRRLWGSQSTAFAVGLPCGICPPEHAGRRR
jgi:hypothetical protein